MSEGRSFSSVASSSTTPARPATSSSPVSPALGGAAGVEAARGAEIDPPPLSAPAEPASDGAVFLAIEWDRETTLPAYFSVAAPDELRARELAASITARRGRVLVDVVTPAFLREQLDRAHAHPADHHWSGGAAESR